MRVKYKGYYYELPLFRAFGFYLRSAWFPFRRFVRAVKRTICSLGSWASTLAVFVPICVIIFSILLLNGMVSLDDAIVELVSIILGSFLLLAIKEIRDFEAKRRTILRRQWEYYDSWRYEFTDTLSDFFRHLGLIIYGYAFLNSVDDWEAAFQNSVNSEPTAEYINGDIEHISEVVASIINTARQEGFIDWNVEQANRLVKEIERFAVELAQNVQSGGSIRREAGLLGECATALLGLVRRPWRYRNDMAHRELMERYLSQYGVRIGL